MLLIEIDNYKNVTKIECCHGHTPYQIIGQILKTFIKTTLL